MPGSILQSDEKYTSVNLYFQDESRFGLFTRNSNATANGVKRICAFHQIFKTSVLFGVFSTVNGNKLLGSQVIMRIFFFANPSKPKLMFWIMTLPINPNR